MMLDVLVDGLSWLLLLAGSFVVVVGALGLVRMPDVFTRMHAGGMIDTFGSLLIFAASVVTGAPLSGLSRFNVTAKSPLTGTIGDSQGGGYWGAELKMAGFDALVITVASKRS